ncbi:MAG: GAF domain-containing protein [Deltaproteobacteria bacterium]|nr:GAF domain-containing protein [Deltaproteobacteria bacterium]
MASNKKNIAIIGANKEALSLLPDLLKDKGNRIVLIADPNPDAMLYKLMELGYRISKKLGISVTYELEDIKAIDSLDVIINAVDDAATAKFLDSSEFDDVEKLSALSARLLWGVRGAVAGHASPNYLGPLREIVNGVKLTSDRDELLGSLLDIAIETSGADAGSIMLVDKAEGALKIEVARGMDEEIIRKVNVKLGDGVSGKVAKDGRPILINGRAKEEEFGRLGTRRGASSAICVPLTIESGVIGVLNVNSSGSKKTFTDADMELLKNLSGLAAEVINRAGEFEKMRIEAAKFDLWKKLEFSMSDHKPLHTRLNTVCRKLSELIPGLTCTIYLYNEDMKRLVIYSSSAKTPPSTGHVSFASGEGVVGAAIEAMKEVVLVDRLPEKRLKRVLMAIPMTAKEQTVGVFVAEISSKRGLSKYNEAFLKEMTALLSESIYVNRRNDEDMAKSKRLVAADEAGLKLIAIRDTEKLYPMITIAAVDILNAEGAVLRIKSSSPDAGFERVATFGIENMKKKESFLPLEDETVKEVQRRKEPVRREFSEDSNPVIRGMLTFPILTDGNVEGFISLFNRFDEESPYAQPFSKNDTEVIARFVAYVERVLAAIRDSAETKDAWDIVTPGLFERRVEEELKRAARFGKQFVFVTARAGELTGIKGFAKKEFIKRLLTYVRGKIRIFDSVAMLDDDTVGILFLETDRRVVDVFNRDILSDAPREFKAGMFYGYACFPGDGETYADILERALTRPLVEASEPS